MLALFSFRVLRDDATTDAVACSDMRAEESVRVAVDSTAALSRNRRTVGVRDPAVVRAAVSAPRAA
jgi:hypothetical protein